MYTCAARRRFLFMGTKAFLLATGPLVLALVLPGSSTAQTANSSSRLANGKPDLNGIWQALNEANYDVEAHVARPAMALRAGSYGPLPASAVLALDRKSTRLNSS